MKTFASLFTVTQNQGGNKIPAVIPDRPEWLNHGRVVAISSRCLARFQTLSDWYELPDKNTIACKGIGNGVPCKLSEQVLLSMPA